MIQNIFFYGLYVLLFRMPMLNPINFQQDKTALVKTDSEIIFNIPDDLAKKSWGSNQPVKDYFKSEPGIFFNQGKYTAPEFFEQFWWPCGDDAEECQEHDINGVIHVPEKEHTGIIERYFSGKEVYNLVQKGSEYDLNEYKPAQLQKDGKIVFTSCFSMGTNDSALLNVTKILGKLSFDFLENPCDSKNSSIESSTLAYSALGTPNIYFGGETINQKFKVEGSAHLFTYQNKLGFIEMGKGQEYVFFNGKRISGPYQQIRYDFNSDYAFPLMEVYDNGALIFIELKGENYFFHQVDLNQFL